MSSKRKEPPQVESIDKVYSSLSEESGSSEDERRPKRRRNEGPKQTDLIESSTFVLDNVLDVTFIEGNPIQLDDAITLKDQNDACNIGQNSILLIVDSLHLLSPLPSKKIRKTTSGECTNCKTDKSPIWRKGPNSVKLCNKWYVCIEDYHLTKKWTLLETV